jgi:adenylate cyclase
MSPMSDIIIANDGTIDKYIGDAIMAYWNAPVDVDHHADQALKSALEQFRALEHLNISLAEKSLPSIDIGIGIHTGEVVVGEMGSKDRSDYTIIGDSVNLCSRIEGLCKAYGVRLLISEDTLKKVTQNYKIREVDRVQVKGKEESVVIYEVIDFGFFDDKEMQRESKYKEALELYYKNQFLEAGVLFDELFTEYNIKLFKIYANRCQKFLRENIELVGGVYRYDTK